MQEFPGLHVLNWVAKNVREWLGTIVPEQMMAAVAYNIDDGDDKNTDKQLYSAYQVIHMHHFRNPFLHNFLLVFKQLNKSDSVSIQYSFKSLTSHPYFIDVSIQIIHLPPYM